MHQSDTFPRLLMRHAAERGEVTKGSIELQGERVERLNPSELVRRGVIQVDGRAPLLRPPHGRREPAHRRAYPRSRPLRDQARPRPRSCSTSPRWGSRRRSCTRFSEFGDILENGRVVIEGSSAQLAENEDVKEFYLGISSGKQKSFRGVKHYRRRKRWLA